MPEYLCESSGQGIPALLTALFGPPGPDIS